MRVGVFTAVAVAMLAAASASRADQCSTTVGDVFIAADGAHNFELAAPHCGKVGQVGGLSGSPPAERLLAPLLRLYEVERASVRITSQHVPAVWQKPSVLASAPFSDRASSITDGVLVSVARAFDIDPVLFYAIVQQESGGRADVVSRKGAQGLMQVMPATAARFGVSSRALSDPWINLEVGATYLKTLQGRYGANLPLVLAAYNAGEGAVARYGSHVPPFRETRRYVSNILANYQRKLLFTVAGIDHRR